MDKLFIKSEGLLKDSYQLAWNVYKSGFRPNYIVGVWRGGAPIGIAVQEFLSVLGVKSDHVAIRTSYYTGINAKKDRLNNKVQTPQGSKNNENDDFTSDGIEALKPFEPSLNKENSQSS